MQDSSSSTTILLHSPDPHAHPGRKSFALKVPTSLERYLCIYLLHLAKTGLAVQAVLKEENSHEMMRTVDWFFTINDHVTHCTEELILNLQDSKRESD